MSNVNDMELMKKIEMFTRKNRPGIGPKRGEFDKDHRGMCPPPEMEGEMRGPEFGRPPMPPFGGPHHPGEEPPFGGPHHPGEPPFGPHGPHFMKRPPLSRERLLVIIGEEPKGIRQKAIIDKVGLGQSSVSELINKLEDDGYVERKVDPSDKRATLLFLTEKGQARALEVEDERKEFFSEIFAKLTEEEKETLSAIMDKLLSE